MKKYRKEIIIFLIQLGMFYVFPMFVGPDSALIHSVWYLVVSAAGIGVGMLLKRV